MEHKYTRIIILESKLIVFIGRIFNRILRLINHAYHLARLREIQKLTNDGFEVKVAQNLLELQHKDFPYTVFIRPVSSDQLVLYQIWKDYEYQYLIELIERNNYTDKITTIIDAGSNIGLTALFLKHHYPFAKIISIEADNNNHTIQLKNFECNKFNKEEIVALNRAIWINNTDNLNISSSFRDGNHWAKSVEVGSQLERDVEAITLQEIVALFGENKIIDILKIDIEGSENNLFANENFLECLSNQIRFLSLEIHDEFNNRLNIQNILIQNNFSIEDVGETTFCINKKLI